MSTGAKPKRTTASVPMGKAPYDPLDLRTLAESMAKVVSEQPVHPLAKVSPYLRERAFTSFTTLEATNPTSPLLKRTRTKNGNSPYTWGKPPERAVEKVEF